MKKLIFHFLLFTVFLFTLSLAEGLFSINTGAATPTVTKSPTPTKSSQNETTEREINSLKERIASRVAQLKLVEKRGIIGTASDITDTQITVSDPKENTRFIDVDELTKFSSPSAKGSFGISDIKKGTTIGILGLYNKQSRRILARFVDVLINPLIVSGKVLNTDGQNFTITLVSENNTYTVEVEKNTATQSYSKEEGLTKSGFSKIKTGQRIMVAGFPILKDKRHLTASRILLFIDIPPKK